MAATLTWAEPTNHRDTRQRALRVQGHRAEYGESSLVTVQTMLEPPDHGSLVATSMTRLTPTAARVLAAHLQEAADEAERSDYRTLVQAVNLLSTLGPELSEVTKRQRIDLKVVLDKIDDGEL